jgi:PPM family protein phosphatase
MGTFRVAAGSNTGRVRKSNEDAAYAGQWLSAVADGLGGHVAGEIASSTVIRALRAFDIEVAAPALLATMSRAVRAASEDLHRLVDEDPQLTGMGTTLTAMLWSGDHAAICQIGDSRAYLLRGGRLRQITEDHVMGKLVSEAAQLAPVLTRYLDGRLDRSPDLALRALHRGDRYLLCSDGLTNAVNRAAIREVLAEVEDAGTAAQRLISLANESGGPDNITVAILDVANPDELVPARVPVLLGAAAPGRL